MHNSRKNAKRIPISQKVALKVIDTSAIKERYVERTLYREAVILRKLSHPNIINLYEAFQISVYCCLATEYVGKVVEGTGKVGWIA